MKIVVIGGTGLIGSKLVSKLREAGHESLAASPDTGVNALTGEGLDEVLAGADVVVDVSNAPAWEDAAVLEFFETSSRNLRDAETKAGVGHHVALSVVGTDRLPASAYFRAKVAQEEAVKAVTLGPNNPVALRELASVSFAQQNYDSARRFYIRALQIDVKDPLSQGYLGCSLVRLGRVTEGMTWIQRAGSGPWTSCAPAPGAVPGTPGVMPQMQQQMPPGYQPAPVSP